jgi:15-cis-phytoene synthase
MNTATRKVVLPNFSSADQVLAAKGRSFHWARRFLSLAHARRATQLYQFCRYIDDLADEAITPKSAALALARAAEAIASGRSADPMLVDAIRLFHECAIPREIPLMLIQGVMSDLQTVAIQNTEALLQYCFHVAGTVGLMMSHALDTHHPAAQAHAIDLGMAMQLTNICRDVSADALLRRRYLPTSMLGPLSPEELVKPDEVVQPLLRRCLHDLLDLADDYYRSADRGLAYLPLRARYAILVAGRVYGSIGSKLRVQGYDCWSARVVVSKNEKLRVTAGALTCATVQPWFWRAAPTHDHALHTAIAPLLKQIPGYGSA